MDLTYEICKQIHDEIEQGKLKPKQGFTEDTFREDGIEFHIRNFNFWYINGNKTNIRVVYYYSPREVKRDYVVGSGTGKTSCIRGKKYGQYAREYNNPEYTPWVKEKQNMHVRYGWGYWWETPKINQPSRSWKRSKIKRQYMKHW